MVHVVIEWFVTVCLLAMCKMMLAFACNLYMLSSHSYAVCERWIFVVYAYIITVKICQYVWQWVLPRMWPVVGYTQWCSFQTSSICPRSHMNISRVHMYILYHDYDMRKSWSCVKLVWCRVIGNHKQLKWHAQSSYWPTWTIWQYQRPVKQDFRMHRQ